jgi:hypothetical protein
MEVECSTFSLVAISSCSLRSRRTRALFALAELELLNFMVTIFFNPLSVLTPISWRLNVQHSVWLQVTRALFALAELELLKSFVVNISNLNNLVQEYTKFAFSIDFNFILIMIVYCQIHPLDKLPVTSIRI